MADFPALPLWTDAYLADTRHLTTCEHGAYLLLLFEAWRRPHCGLPDDDELLARLAGLTGPEWAAIRTVIMAFWERDGRRKTWHQKRLKKERTYVALKSRSQRHNATKRWNKTKKTDAMAMPNACQNDAPTPTPTPTTPLAKANGEKSDPNKVFWDNAKAYLAPHVKGSPGALIGKWARDYGQGVAASAISDAQLARAVEPVAYIEKTLRKTKATAEEEYPIC